MPKLPKTRNAVKRLKRTGTMTLKMNLKAEISFAVGNIQDHDPGFSGFLSAALSTS
jgi:hypothetical protein